jgi:phage/plasmid-like protein (TIGR03299 family)
MTVNVNDKFDALKADQIKNQGEGTSQSRRDALEARYAAGELSRHETSSHIVYTERYGYDAGERWTVAKASNEILASHGLDISADGRVALYTRVPAWHALGTVVPAGLSDADAVLRAAGLDWLVEKVPVQYTVPFVSEDGAGFLTSELPRSYVTVRTDTGAGLGVVGEIYTALQNHEAYDMLTDLMDLGMVCESAGALTGGARVWVMARLPEPAVIDPSGVADVVSQYVAILNGHDGKTPLTGLTTPWLIRCGNTHRFAINGATAKWKIRHTRNARLKIEAARQTLGLTAQYYQEFVQEETLLVHTPVTTNDVDALIAEIWAVDPDAPKRAQTIAADRRDRVMGVWAIESERLGANAYAAENAITGMIDHFAELRPRGDLRGNRLAALGAAILSEANDGDKVKAHRHLMTLVNR